MRLLRSSFRQNKFGGMVIAGIFFAALCLFACKKEKQEENACKAVALQGSHLSFANASGPYTFTTHGGATIVIDTSRGIIVTHRDYSGFRLELWGGVAANGVTTRSANHESLNGKHIKDRFGSRRTIILPDSSKITYVADGEQGKLLSVSLYDGAESHRITFDCYVLAASSTVLSIAQKMDADEADGETAAVEFTASGLLYVNIYTEPEPSNKTMNRVLLGEIYRASPSVVNDYFDDPRLGHT